MFRQTVAIALWGVPATRISHRPSVAPLLVTACYSPTSACCCCRGWDSWHCQLQQLWRCWHRHACCALPCPQPAATCHTQRAAERWPQLPPPSRRSHSTVCLNAREFCSPPSTGRRCCGCPGRLSRLPRQAGRQAAPRVPVCGLTPPGAPPAARATGAAGQPPPPGARPGPVPPGRSESCGGWC